MRSNITKNYDSFGATTREEKAVDPKNYIVLNPNLVTSGHLSRSLARVPEAVFLLVIFPLLTPVDLAQLECVNREFNEYVLQFFNTPFYKQQHLLIWTMMMPCVANHPIDTHAGK